MSEQVKRYTPTDIRMIPKERRKKEYVDFADYAALLLRAESAEAEVKRQRDVFGSMRHDIYSVRKNIADDNLIQASLALGGIQGVFDRELAQKGENKE